MANAAFFSHRNLFDSPIVQFQTSTLRRSNGEKKIKIEVVEAAPLSDNLCKSTEAIKIGSLF